jgi:hypothetical protein
MSPDYKILVMALAQQVLGPESPTLIKKIEEIRAKYSEHCWDHMDELNQDGTPVLRRSRGEQVRSRNQRNRARVKAMDSERVFIFFPSVAAVKGIEVSELS